MTTKLVPVDDGSALDNPMHKITGEDAGQVLALGFVAAGTFYAANEATKAALKSASAGKDGDALLKAQVDTLGWSAAAKIGGGAVVGIGGRAAFGDSGWGHVFTDGIAAGLITSGVMDAKGAFDLQQKVTTVVMTQVAPGAYAPGVATQTAVAYGYGGR